MCVLCVCVCSVLHYFVITFNRLNEDFDISIELLGGAVGGVGGVGGAIGGVGVSPDSSNPIRIQQIARVSSSESDGGPASPSRGGGN